MSLQATSFLDVGVITAVKVRWDDMDAACVRMKRRSCAGGMVSEQVRQDMRVADGTRKVEEG